MEKKNGFLVTVQSRGRIDTSEFFYSYEEAYDYAAEEWNSLHKYDKRSHFIEITKHEITLDDDGEENELTEIALEENEIFKVGYDFFMLNGKSYHVFDLKGYKSGEQIFDINLKDLNVDWDNFEIFENSYQDEIILAYKAFDKSGNQYEVAIAHDIFEGVISSENDKYTSEMDIIITYLN